MKPIARLGDLHECPKRGYQSPNKIVSASEAICEGKQVALVGDKCECGGVITTSSKMFKVDGKPVAIIGSEVSCGGKIISGAKHAKA